MTALHLREYFGLGAQQKELAGVAAGPLRDITLLDTAFVLWMQSLRRTLLCCFAELQVGCEQGLQTRQGEPCTQDANLSELLHFASQELDSTSITVFLRVCLAH